MLHPGTSINLISFGSILKGKKGKKYVVDIWLEVGWISWKWRNVKIFANEEFLVDKLMEKLKARL